MRALLMIADIGGYTKFMTVHRINLAHAQHVVGRLLEAVIDAASPRYTLAKLEGDAAFFYVKLSEAPRAGELEKFPQELEKIRQAFLDRREELAINRVCSCDGCVQAGQLTLKFVSHLGEIVIQKVKRYTEVAGVDVITVHRFLKNTVTLSEYVLMSSPVLLAIGSDFCQLATPGREDLEGLGQVETHVVDLRSAFTGVGRAAPSRARAWWNWLKMTWRSVPYFLGIKKACEGFLMLPSITGPDNISRPALPNGERTSAAKR